MEQPRQFPSEDDSDRLFEQLAADEPPLLHDDTSPSATAPRPAIHLDGLWQQYLGGMMLLAALIFTIAAGLLIFLNNEPESDTEQIASTDIFDKPTSMPAPSVSTPVPTTVVAIEPEIPGYLPTAAVDEAAIALLTPVPVSTVGTGITRMNLPFTQRSGSVERQFVNYTIQSGDTLDDLAKRFSLGDICTIVWSNDRRSVSPLRVGAHLIIPPEDGVFYKIRNQMTIAELAETTGVAAELIIDSPYNGVLEGATPENLLQEGMQIMVPGGNGGNCNIWVARPAPGGSGSGAAAAPAFTDISQTASFYGLSGCDATIAGGGFPSTHPVPNSQFFQGFSAYHTGVDMSAAVGTPVLAAGAGTVIFAGWNSYGYGNTIVIAHATTFTLYGHLSDGFAIRCGQSVSAGQTIAYVGLSGNTNGPHLHFEIRNANFDPVDPCYTIRC